MYSVENKTVMDYPANSILLHLQISDKRVETVQRNRENDEKVELWIEKCLVLYIPKMFLVV